MYLHTQLLMYKLMKFNYRVINTTEFQRNDGSCEELASHARAKATGIP